jgi:hypothetical protein
MYEDDDSDSDSDAASVPEVEHDDLVHVAP